MDEAPATARATVGARSLAWSMASTFGTQIAIAVLSLVNVLLVARTLGPTGRGDVAFLTTIAYFTSQLALLGVSQGNVNFASSDTTSRAARATTP